MRFATTTTFALAVLAQAFPLPVLSAQTVGGTEDLKWRFDGQAPGDRLGGPLSSAGDVDGDGFDDLVVGAPFANPNGLRDAGSVFVFSGATGAQLLRLDGLSIGDNLGGSVAGAGDVDGDGFGDLVVGAPGASPNGLTRAGSAFVFSGAWTGKSGTRSWGPP